MPLPTLASLPLPPPPVTSSHPGPSLNDANLPRSMRSLRVLKSFRVLRVVKMFRYLESLQQIAKVSGGTPHGWRTFSSSLPAGWTRFLG